MKRIPRKSDGAFRFFARLRHITYSPFLSPSRASRPTFRTGSRTEHGASAVIPMSKRNNETQKASLAVSLAAGVPAGVWAKERGIPARTAYRWARLPEVRALVDRYRARVIDRAIGQLTQHVIKAVEEIGRLSKEAESESVRLQASRAVIVELLAITDYARIERRLAVVERRLRQTETRALES